MSKTKSMHALRVFFKFLYNSFLFSTNLRLRHEINICQVLKRTKTHISFEIQFLGSFARFQKLKKLTWWRKRWTNLRLQLCAWRYRRVIDLKLAVIGWCFDPHQVLWYTTVLREWYLVLSIDFGKRVHEMSAEKRFDIFRYKLCTLGSILGPVGVVTDPVVRMTADQPSRKHGKQYHWSLHNWNEKSNV